ncbi:hypothetical protein A7E78_12980 [Syntrophotalea acetylenivorans]|uniref:DUF805 domain-containing protein n=1 Tax=Syntrophotalea acetylenivorans TaxID=1842532 RepID=A0A1L3GRY8_9BACT|nr:DUF805 domain-containing protein [Syntrophotalea acetylenivorans]APG28665.1 hypothetical protein A7E78_12980 [Syntrophotalea acetylenivorans]
MNWYLDVLKKYFVFQGRARRKEYWMFTLFNMLVYIALMIIEGILGMGGEGGLGLLSTLYTLAVLLPALGVSVRRLHDTGRSGWWLLIGLVPLIGGIVLFIFMVLDSQPASNQYGPNPKEGDTQVSLESATS